MQVSFAIAATSILTSAYLLYCGRRWKKAWLEEKSVAAEYERRFLQLYSITSEETRDAFEDNFVQPDMEFYEIVEHFHD